MYLGTDLHTFIQYLNISRELLQNGGLIIRFSHNKINVRIDDKKLNENQNIDQLILRSVFQEVSSIMFAILSNHEDKLLDQVRDEYNEKLEENENVDKLIRNKIDLIKETIITDALKERFLIKKTSKENILGNLIWEINTKEYDSSEKVVSLKYAKLSFVIEKENSLFPIDGAPPSKEKFSFDVDSFDIDYLIEVLKDIKKRINRVYKVKRS